MGNIGATVMKKKLTVRGINALKPAERGKRYVIWDTEVANFGVRVTDAGKASFIVMRRVDGKLLRRAVGEYRLGTEYKEGLLAQVRTDARAALADMGVGIDPKQRQKAEKSKDAERKSNTFGAVAEEFITRHVAKLRSGAEVAAAIRREIVTKWGERPIVEISRRDVVKLLEEVVDSGRPYIAHHLLAYLSKLFNWAIARDMYGLGASPITRGLAKDIIGAKKPRQRVLNDDELRRIWVATDMLGHPFGQFVRMLLITGQRLREVAEARWDEFDLERGLWTIPPERMKGDAAHEVPLPPIAVDLLRSLPRHAGPCVFSTTKGKSPISGFSKAKVALDRLLGDMPGWVYHDLRRTVRTHLSGLPVPDLVAELVIAHAKPGLHKVYDQHGYRDEKRRALELWASKLMSIVAGVPNNTNIVRLMVAR
jgi:integrase